MAFAGIRGRDLIQKCASCRRLTDVDDGVGVAAAPQILNSRFTSCQNCMEHCLTFSDWQRRLPRLIGPLC